MLLCHTISFFAGFVLDLILGDPYFLPHPVRLMGKLISFMEKHLLKETKEQLLTDRQKFRRGCFLAAVLLLMTGMVSLTVLFAAYFLGKIQGIVVESVMTYQILATKCLRTESMKVYKELKTGSLEGARKAVSMIVGRDTESLDEKGIIRAAIETVAENCSDGVIAPMLYLAAGGPLLGFLYKAVNTMDSMVGYKNDTYLYFGRAAARLDDGMNFLPARISAWLMISAAFLPGGNYNGKQAYRIFKRDRLKHESPNSAQTESVCAGALSIRLAGDAVYFGRTVKKPFIGDAVREVECRDIVKVNRLLYRTAFLCEAFCLLILLNVIKL